MPRVLKSAREYMTRRTRIRRLAYLMNFRFNAVPQELCKQRRHELERNKGRTEGRRNAAGKKAAATRKHRAAERKAARTRTRRATATKPVATRARKKEEAVLIQP